MGFLNSVFGAVKDAAVNFKDTAERLNSYDDEKLIKIVKRAYKDRDMNRTEVILAAEILKKRGYVIKDVVQDM